MAKEDVLRRYFREKQRDSETDIYGRYLKLKPKATKQQYSVSKKYRDFSIGDSDNWIYVQCQSLGHSVYGLGELKVEGGGNPK